MANDLENSNLLQLEQAIESARKEVENAERVFRVAEDVHNKVKAIPKGKAGGGKKAKSEALKNYQDAKNHVQEKNRLLEDAQKRLAEFSSGHSTMVNSVDTTEDISKRPGDAVPADTMSPMKRQCIDNTQTLPGSDLRLDPGPRDTSTDPGSYINAQAEGLQAISNTMDVPIAFLGPSGTDIGLNAQNSTGGPDISDKKTPALSPSFRDIEKDRRNADLDNGCVPFGDSDFEDEQAKTDGEPADKDDVEMHASEEPKIAEGNDDYDSGVSDISGPGTEFEYDEDLPDYPSDTGSEKKDEVRREKATKYKHVDLNADEKELYRFMTDRDKKKMTNKGQEAIKKFVQKGESISTTIRRMARTDPTFLPEAATTSRTVAIHFLTSKDGNIQCGYHAFKNKTTCARDGWGKEGMKIRGVPGKRSLSDQRKNNIVKPPAKGLGNCGCRIDDILLEFYLSKCLSIDGVIGGKEVSEMMMGVQDYMEPRDRSFAFEAIRFLSPFFSLDDFFHHGSPAHQEVKIAKKYAVQSLDMLNMIYRRRVPEGDVDLSKEFVLVSKAKLLQLEEKVKMLREIDEVSRAMDI